MKAMFGDNSCAMCGKDRGYNKRFCSWECLKEWHKQKKGGNKCIVCGKDRGYNRKTCSLECLNKYRQKVRDSNFSTMNCVVCGKEFEYNAKQYPNRKYCGRECFKIVQYHYGDLKVPFGRVLLYLRNNLKVSRKQLKKIADVSGSVIQSSLQRAMESGYGGVNLGKD